MHVFPNLFFGTLREHYIMLFGAAGAIATFAGFVGAWIGARFAMRAAVREMRESSASSIQSEQLRQLAAGVDEIALEIERITEAQRFVAKVLVERRDALPVVPPRVAGSITPH
jgi:hypothetical protein